VTHDFNWEKPTLAHSTDSNGLSVGAPVKNWSPREAPPRSAIEGQFCRLEPFSVKSHHEHLYKAFILDSDHRNWTYLPYGPFHSQEDFRVWCEQECAGDDPLFHTVFDKSTNQVTGMASYLRITPDVGCIEVGHIHFSPLMQKTRLATECMYLMMRRVFDELGYRRYEWKCNALNTPSCKAAERLGFKFEGIFRQATIAKNLNRDTAWFSILDEEWLPLKAGYESWLAGDNFDSDGQQIRSLQACIQSTPL